jgi:hypothetical protein
VLAPGGRLVVLDWRRDDPLVATLDRVLRLVDPAHARTLTSAELEAALDAAGFRVTTLARPRVGAWALVVAVAHR